nr:ABC transporter permease [uncultured Desulfobulbus sp.]
MNSEVDISLTQAFSVQRRVIWALMLRESKTLFGKHKLGYLWAVIQAAFTLVVFWVIRELAGVHAPHGMSTPVFLLGGFIPWFIFSNGVTNGMNAIGGNRGLLTYPQVYPLDLLLARIILQGAMQTLVLVVLLFVSYCIGQQVSIESPHSIFFSLLLALALGLGSGMACSAFNLLWPVTEQLIPMMLRVLFFTSGLFFSVLDLPASAQNILYYNPLTHIIELMRQGFAVGYGEQYISYFYLTSVTLLLLTTGLLLERYSRRYLDRLI